MPAGMGFGFVFFVFFGASPDLASLDAIKNNQRTRLVMRKMRREDTDVVFNPSELSTFVTERVLCLFQVIQAVTVYPLVGGHLAIERVT